MGITDMKNSYYNINRLLLSNIQGPLGPTTEKKTTVRTNPQQTAFIEEVQRQLPGSASFNDAISTVIDLVAHYTLHPNADMEIGRERSLSLFSQHGIPGIHINRLLELLDIPKATAASLANASNFSDHLTEPAAESLAEFFGVSKGYIRGRETSPYVVPIIENGAELEYLENWIDSLRPECQPQVTLILFECDEPSQDEVIAFLRIEHSLDMHFLFHSYKPVGRFIGNSIDFLENSFALMLSKYKARKFTLTKTIHEFERIRRGSFLD